MQKFMISFVIYCLVGITSLAIKGFVFHAAFAADISVDEGLSFSNESIQPKQYVPRMNRVGKNRQIIRRKMTSQLISITDIEDFGMVPIAFEMMWVGTTQDSEEAEGHSDGDFIVWRSYHASILNSSTSAVYGTLQILTHGEAGNSPQDAAAQTGDVKDFMEWFFNLMLQDHERTKPSIQSFDDSYEMQDVSTKSP